MSKSKIWLHFVKLGRTEGFKQNRTCCKYCDYELNHAVGRCELHLKKCSSVPVSVLQSLFGPNFSQDTNLIASSIYFNHKLKCPKNDNNVIYILQSLMMQMWEEKVIKVMMMTKVRVLMKMKQLE